MFCYNRPNLLKKTLISIAKSRDIHLYDFFFFIDGSKNDLDLANIYAVENLVKNFNFCKSKKIFKRIKNYGLSKNIIEGVSEVLNDNKAAIILEDDLILNLNAINFINYFLNFRYKSLGSVSAYSYLHNSNLNLNFQACFVKRHSSWCWGTWSDTWNKINWNKKFYKSHFDDKLLFENLGYDMNLMLWGYLNNFIDSWAIRFNYHCMKNNLLSLQPRFSLVKNIGVGLNATNQKFKNNEKIKFNNFKIKNFKDLVILKESEIDNYIKKNHKKSIRLYIKYIFHYFFKKN